MLGDESGLLGAFQAPPGLYAPPMPSVRCGPLTNPGPTLASPCSGPSSTNHSARTDAPCLEFGRTGFLNVMLSTRTLLVCLALTVCGCRRHPTDAEVTRIAHDYIAAKYSWADKAAYEVRKDKENWTVTVHPPAPAAEGTTILFIEIDRKGQVVGFL